VPIFKDMQEKPIYSRLQT